MLHSIVSSTSLFTNSPSFSLFGTASPEALLSDRFPGIRRFVSVSRTIDVSFIRLGPFSLPAVDRPNCHRTATAAVAGKVVCQLTRRRLRWQSSNLFSIMPGIRHLIESHLHIRQMRSDFSTIPQFSLMAIKLSVSCGNL